MTCGRSYGSSGGHHTCSECRGKLENLIEPLELLPGMAFPIGFLILICGVEQVGGMLEDDIRKDIVLKAERILDADSQVIHTLVQEADDMEVVIADDGLGKTGRSGCGKVGVYITADEMDFGALFERKLEEIIPEEVMVNGGEDVKDNITIGIGNDTVVFKYCSVSVQGSWNWRSY